MNKKIQTTELNFDDIKQSLKTYLSGQAEFSDYNFEGSGLSILLDVLALNTHYNALYLNLAVNESFLDSASKRSSVVSKAKEIGYVPRSSKSSSAKVNITMINEQVDAPIYIEIPKYATFSSNIDGTTYNFYTMSSYISYKTGTSYVFNDVILKEGTLFTYSFSVNDGAHYVLPNDKIDTSTILVTVKENIHSSVYDVYKESDSIVNIESDSKVYFLKENHDGLYELEFGNDVIGKKLSNGNIINVTYLICNEELPNGISNFTYNGNIPVNTTSYITVVDSAHGGSAPESIDSIKWNAPRVYTAQNRCVTVDDYISLIKSMYDVSDVNVWGGETNIPPQYGKVFISVVPKNTNFLTEDDKDYILSNIINPRKGVSITPEFIDPDYLKLKITVTYKYNPAKTQLTADDISSIILDTIMNYKTNTLNTFSGVFRQSKLTAEIDNSEDSITSNTIDFTIHREVTPIFNLVSGYKINIGNSIYKSAVPAESLLSSGFYIPNSSNVHYIDDIPNSVGNSGQLRLFYRDNKGLKVQVAIIGTVNYITGSIEITDLNIRGLYLTDLTLVIKPELKDIKSNRNQFVTIEPHMVTINPLIDNE